MVAARSFVVGKLAPEISGHDRAGKPFSLVDNRGKVTLFTFSGNLCSWCVAMISTELLRCCSMRHHVRRSGSTSNVPPSASFAAKPSHDSRIVA